MQITDQLHRVISFSKTPKRIVSLVPSLTELICDLGLESRLVGVTKFCVHPKHIKTKATVVGGTKQVKFDTIAKLQPDVILCNKEENTKAMIDELEGLAPVHISDINSIPDCLELINMYGKLFKVDIQSHKLVDSIVKRKLDFDAFVASQAPKKVAYFIWKDPWMVVGQQTFIDYMLSLNGFENYFYKQDRYPQIQLDDIFESVNLVLLSSEPYPFNSEHFKLLKPAFPNAQFLLVDGEMFSWYGSRLLKAFRYFRNLHQNHL